MGAFRLGSRYVVHIWLALAIVPQVCVLGRYEKPPCSDGETLATFRGRSLCVSDCTGEAADASAECPQEKPKDTFGKPACFMVPAPKGDTSHPSMRQRYCGLECRGDSYCPRGSKCTFIDVSAEIDEYGDVNPLARNYPHLISDDLLTGEVSQDESITHSMGTTSLVFKLAERQVLLNSAANGSKVQPLDCTSVPEEEQELSEITVHQWCRHIEDILNRTHKELFSRLDAWMLESFAPGRADPALRAMHLPRGNRGTGIRQERLKISSTDDPIARLMLAENSERSRILRELLMFCDLVVWPAMPTMIPGKSKVLDDEEHEKVALEKSKIRKVSRCSLPLLSGFDSDRYGVMADASSALEVVFLIELLMRMGAQGQSFFCSYDRANLFWNYLDAVLVGVSVVESILVLVLVEDTEIGMSNKLRTMRIVRLTRLVRLLRAIRFFAGLRTLIYSIFYTLKLGLGILLTDATLAHVITYENSTMTPWAGLQFAGRPPLTNLVLQHLSMHTLFRSITGGVDWSSLAVALAPLNWIWVYLFSAARLNAPRAERPAYIAFCLFAVLNVMTGVFCQRATELAEKDHDAQLLAAREGSQKLHRYSSTLMCRNLFRRFDVAKQGKMDQNGLERGSLTLLEFELMFQRDDIKASLQVLDIAWKFLKLTPGAAWQFVWEEYCFFRLLDTDGDGDVREQDFTEGNFRLWQTPAFQRGILAKASKTSAAKALPRVDGKVFAITGTTSGTGFVAAWVVAELGGTVLLLNRTSQRVSDSMDQLKTIVPEGKFIDVACDLQDFESVRKAAAEIKSKYKMLYCLSLNAGIMATPDKATKDGYDTQMQTNHLSHFLLAAELFPLL
ncbi:putative oxidoreductase [Symbiodinium microadriaticum]|uniref:Putative oxidoreductase n=1 Tax=Symbiodinium microadriaticum TaxID=2951 RepID=A0A1Q9E8C2_SYMMI|nr:putative oxidoreductase [Symbiodinium microadriaticum]